MTKMRVFKVALLLLLTGCGEPFTLECDPPPDEKTRIIVTGPVEYPTGTAVVPLPHPPRPTRPGPDAGTDASYFDASDASDLDAGEPDAALDGTAPLPPYDDEDLDDGVEPSQ